VGRARVWPSFGRVFFMLFSDLAGLTCVGPGKWDKSARPVEWAKLVRIKDNAYGSQLLRISIRSGSIPIGMLRYHQNVTETAGLGP
jgi:hypothetical protein